MKRQTNFIRIFFVLFIFLFSNLVVQSQTPTTNSSNQTKNKIVLKNLTLIDVENAEALQLMSIVIEDDKIKSIFPSSSPQIEKDARVIDMKGHYAIPGLIDSHVHLFRPKNRKEILKKLLYSGITSVRDMGGDARMYQKLNQEIKQGTLEGPDIYYSANFFGQKFLKDPRTKFAARGFEPGEAPWMRVITDETDLKEAVRQAKNAGVTGIKVYSNVSPELLKAVSKEAHSQGLKVWSHSSVFPSKPSDAVKAKVDVISHGLGMIAEPAERMPDSFNESIREFMPLQDFKNANASSAVYLSLFEMMKSSGTIFEPTISASRGPANAKIRQKPNDEKENPTAHLAEAAKKLDRKAIIDWVKRITKSAYENDVMIAAGTDFSKDIKWVQDEVIFLTEYGLSNIDAIKAATLNNALAIGIEKTHGSISVGKQANLVILSKNPLENIENLRSVKIVFKNGKSYSTNMSE